MQPPLCVLVTRPDPAGGELCRLLAEQGDRVLHFPTLAFAPPADAQAFEQAVLQAGDQDWLIFISPHAVHASIPALRRAWPVFPPKTQFAAIGAGTAQALHAAGINAIHPQAGWHSEALLVLPVFQHMNGKKVGIVKGAGGRDILEKTLQARGATVLPVIAYQRLLPVVDEQQLSVLRDEKIDVIICASGESVQNLKQLTNGAAWNTLSTVPLIVVSERIKSLAEDLGFRTIWVAPNAEHQTMVAFLAQKKDQL